MSSLIDSTRLEDAIRSHLCNPEWRTATAEPNLADGSRAGLCTQSFDGIDGVDTDLWTEQAICGPSIFDAQDQASFTTHAASDRSGDFSWDTGQDVHVQSPLSPSVIEQLLSTFANEGPNDLCPAICDGFVNCAAQHAQLLDSNIFPTVYRPQVVSKMSITAPNDPLANAHGPFEAIDDDGKRWQATLERSHAAERSFLYGVTTTHIYCRPSCPSRRPARKHAIFFLFPDANEKAQRAEYRACRRCKPETLRAVDGGLAGIAKTLDAITRYASDVFGRRGPNDMKLEALADMAGLSSFHFHRLFKTTVQMTPGDCVPACRALALGDALGLDWQRNHGLPDVASLINKSSTWTPRSTRKALGGISPSTYSIGAVALKIERISIAAPQGSICIAYTQGKGGVLAVALGENAETEVKTRFPCSIVSSAHASSLSRILRDLHEACEDREYDIPAYLQPMLRRARIWSKLVKDDVLRTHW